MMNLTMHSFSKAWLLVLLLTAGMAQSLAQAPQSFSYQAVIRDAAGTLVKSGLVGIRISILQSTSEGAAIYTETHTPMTNTNGLVSLMVGMGTTSDNFSEIDWSAGPYFIKTETDPTGGTTYTISGTTQLSSVPYSLFSKGADHASNADNATTADNATNAATAATATNAAYAGHATTADNATNAVTAQNVTNFPFNPYEVYVKAGATDGTGTQAKPFATIAEGYTAVTATGTIHILAGTYNVTTNLTVSKAGITLKGYPGTIVVLQAAVIAFTVTGAGATIDGLTITSDNPHAVEFIQFGGTNQKLINNLIYGASQAGPSTGWVVNRGFVTQGAATNMIVNNNILHSLRQPAYLNPNSTGHITHNVVYNTRGFVVDRAVFVFSGNSWGTPENAVDIALLVGTSAGAPYDALADLSANNSTASIQDSR